MKDERINIVDYCVEKNGFDYNIRKASEEFQELALVLTQLSLKPYKVNQKEVTDEIGDCIFRLEILKKIFPIEEINKRVEEKRDKYNFLIINNKDIKI